MTSATRAVAGPLRILAISGSLRARSSNTSLLKLAMGVAPDDMEIVLYDGLASLPHFNPDDDVDVPPASVLGLRALVGEADGLLICSPEYAHGVPGALKNALDWLVSGPDVPGLPVAVVNATTRAHHAHASLVETLRTMSADVVEAASVRLPLAPAQRTAEAILADPAIAAMLTAGLNALLGAVRGSRGL